MRTAAVYIRVCTRNVKGEQKSAIKFHKFPSVWSRDRKTNVQIRSKGSWNARWNTNFCSRAWLTRKTGRFVRAKKWRYEEPWCDNGCHSLQRKSGGYKDTRGIKLSFPRQVHGCTKMKYSWAAIEGQHFTYGTLQRSTPVFSFLSRSVETWAKSHVGEVLFIFHRGKGNNKSQKAVRRLSMEISRLSLIPRCRNFSFLRSITFENLRTRRFIQKRDCFFWKGKSWLVGFWTVFLFSDNDNNESKFVTTRILNASNFRKRRKCYFGTFASTSLELDKTRISRISHREQSRNLQEATGQKVKRRRKIRSSPSCRNYIQRKAISRELSQTVSVVVRKKKEKGQLLPCSSRKSKSIRSICFCRIDKRNKQANHNNVKYYPFGQLIPFSRANPPRPTCLDHDSFILFVERDCLVSLVRS